MKHLIHRHPLRKEDAARILSQQLDQDALHMDIDRMQECIDVLYPDLAEECEADWEALDRAVRQQPSPPARGRVHPRCLRTAGLVAAAFLLTTLSATAIASALGAPWTLHLFWLPDRLIVEADQHAILKREGRDTLIVPAEDSFADALRRHQINHRFPPVPEGWTLVELVDEADEPAHRIDAMYTSKASRFGLSYDIVLPDYQNPVSTTLMDLFKDPGDPIVDSYDGYDFYFYQDESYGNIFVDYSDCLFHLSSPASLEELRETIRQLYGGD